MLEKMILAIASVAISLLGLYVVMKPDKVIRGLYAFCKNYPLIRYAGEKQLTSRRGVVRLLGAIFVVVGLVCLFSVYL